MARHCQDIFDRVINLATHREQPWRTVADALDREADPGSWKAWHHGPIPRRP